MVRMSEPDSSRWVAKEWRRAWRADRFGDAGGEGGAADGALDHGLVQVVAAALARRGST